MIRKSILVSFLFGGLLGSLFAGTTGKIKGQITDLVSGEPLIGVNVMVKELGIGAATDDTGYYIILNVRPGRYTVSASMIGYTPVTVEKVDVTIGLTTDINIQMGTEVLGMEAVRVVSERPAVVKDLSGSQLNIRAETITQMPVSSISSVLGLQAGVEELSVRGGSSYQTAIILDGFSMTDSRSNIPISSFSLSSVEEIQLLSGGFNAEYGNIRSGIVNITTAEGNFQGYGGTFSLQYSPPTPKNFGISPYSEESYFLRPYLDPAVAWTGTDNGAWDDYTRRQYPSFEGWNAYADIFLQDDDPDNDLTPTGAQRIFLWEHRRNGEITKPDYVLDMGFGGPVPLVSESLGKLRFYLSHRSEQEMFVFPLSRDAYTANTTRLKLNSDISPKIKVILNFQYSEDYSVNPYNWTTVPTGSVLRGTYAVANLASEGALFTPGYFSPTSIYRSNVGLKLNHMLNAGTFYEISIQYLRNEYDTYQTELRDTTLIELFPGTFEDEAPYGYDASEWMNLGRDSSITSTTIAKIDFTHQLNKHNQIKSGAQIEYNDYRVRSFTESAKDTWRRSLVYNVYPYRISAYLQDKLEYEGFIANLGLRAEYASANTNIYILDPYDAYFSQGLGELIEEKAPTKEAEPTFTLSPRLGVAHPITDHSKLYFNYGHFYSEPQSSYRFRLQRESNGLVTYLGNPDLGQERTIAYELGYSHSLNNTYLFDVASYYKDVTAQPGWIVYTNANGSVNYSKAENNNYEDIRGIEFTLTKTRGNWFSGFVNYTYMVKTSGYFGLLHYYENPQEQREYEEVNRREFEPEPEPYFRANLVFHSPERYGPRISGVRPLANWQMSFLAYYQAGVSRWSETDQEYLPYVDTYNVDTRLSKSVAFGGYEVEFFVDVNNLLNTKWLSNAGFSDVFDLRAYIESLHFSWEEGLEHGDDRYGDFRPDDVAYEPLEANPDNDPEIEARNDIRRETKSYIDMPNYQSLTFLNPRKITSGIRINF